MGAHGDSADATTMNSVEALRLFLLQRSPAGLKREIPSTLWRERQHPSNWLANLTAGVHCERQGRIRRSAIWRPIK